MQIKKLVIILTLFMSCTLAAQTDTLPADTITLSTFSTQAIKEITADIQEIQKAAQLLGIAKVTILNEELQKRYSELSQKLMLVVSAYIDPETFIGLTADQKIIKRR